MPRRARPAVVVIALFCLSVLALSVPTVVRAAEEKPADQKAKVGKLPHLTFDARTKQVRVECEALAVDAPLEFFCVLAGGPEHEAVLRTAAKPSDLHTALLAVGLKPGKPVTYSPAAKKWFPPQGPPVQIHVEYQKDGKPVSAPAYRWMRDVKGKKEMPALTWVFVGSRVMDDGNYAADVTGYVVSVVNFDLTVIDIPELKSNSNELLEWERNPDLAPPKGTAVTMVIEPAGKEGDPAAAQPADAAPADDGADAAEDPATPKGAIDMPLVKVGPDGAVTLDDKPVDVAHLTEALEAMKEQRPLEVVVAAAMGADAATVRTVVQAVEAADVPVQLRVTDDNTAQEAADDAENAEPQGAGDNEGDDDALSGVRADEKEIEDLTKYWHGRVRPHGKALRDAAQTHYDVINKLRREQQRLIDESDRIQRAIDRLEREYQDLTTPRPAPQE